MTRRLARDEGILAGRLLIAHSGASFPGTAVISDARRARPARPVPMWNTAPFPIM